MARNRKPRNSSKNSSKTDGYKRGAVDGKEDKASKPEGGSTGSETERKEDAKNDPEWYGRDERLLIDSSSLPYSEPFGSDNELNWTGPGVTGAQIIAKGSVENRVPGIAVFNTVPACGNPKDRNSPANVAATAIYTQVRYVNNGRKNYDPADLFMYLGTIADLYSFLNWCRRIYGCANLYSQANLYIGKSLLYAQGVDAGDVLSNLANFRYWINAFTNKIASYAVPSEMTYFFRRAFEYSNYYIEHEGDSIKDQLYMYNPVAFYKFRLFDKDSTGMLTLEPVNSNPSVRLSVQSIMAYGEGLLSEIWGDEDFGLMSGDLMKAFDGKIMSLTALPEDFMVLPIHDKAVLTQMENSCVTPVHVESFKEQSSISGGTAPYYTHMRNGATVYYQSGAIYQDGSGNLFSKWLTPGVVVQSSTPSGNPTNITQFAHAALTKIVNIHEASGNPGLTIEAIQNKCSLRQITGGGYAPRADNVFEVLCGVNIVTSVEIFNLTTATGSASLIESHKLLFGLRADYSNDSTNNLNTSGQDYAIDQYIMAKTWFWKALFCFKYLPKVMQVGLSTPSNPPATVGNFVCLSNLDTYAIIPEETLQHMLEVSLLSMLYVPGVAKFVNYSA